MTNPKPHLREALATVFIAGSRITGDGVPAQENFIKAGYKDENEYWDEALSELMIAGEFAHRLHLHLTDPTCSYNWQGEIEKALLLALKEGERWFIGDIDSADLGGLMLRPRPAAEWLLSKPKRKYLVPPGLRDFLCPPPPTSRNAHEAGGVVQAAPAKQLVPRKPAGRPAVVGPRVKAEMRDAIQRGEMTLVELRDMTEKVLAHRFNACRDICRNARNAVESEIVG